MSKIPDDFQRQNDMIREAQKSLAAYNDLLNETKEIHENIVYVESKLKDLKAEELVLQNKLASASKSQKAAIQDDLDAKQEAIRMAEEGLELGRKELELRKGALAQIKQKNLYLKEGLSITRKLGEKVLQQTGYLLEQQKAVKETELSMGILSNQSKGFRNNIYRTSISTTEIGVNTKELAKMQGTYADNVGRAVQLNESQLQAIAEIGKGTMLGTEASAELAANFESVGIGAEGTRDFIQESLQLSTKMGVASSKTIKTIQKNFKLLNKYNFKGGVSGFGKMAALATKFKFEMESITQFADKIMTPEGAVEVASKLQVLGGEWAKLGDPFELMYRSRNDITGLTEDIINATKATATFDETTGEFRISPMELSRLREVAGVTGQSAEALAEMAKQKAKFDKVESLIPAAFSQEDKEYLSSLATFDKTTGKYKINLTTESGDKINENVGELTKITPALVKSQMAFDETLKERAKNAMTFNERFGMLVEKFQSSLLPAFEVVANLLEKAIDWLEPVVTKIAKFLSEEPKWVAAIGAALAGAALLGDMAMWVLRGKWLRMGFGGLGGGGLGGGQMVTSKTGKQYPANSPQGKMITNASSPLSRMDKLKGKGFMGGRFAAGTKGAVGAGIGLGVAGMGLDYGRSQMTDPDSGWGKAAGVGSMALQGAGLGMLLGPVGAGVGALVGGLIGAAQEFGKVDSKASSGTQTTYQDFVARPGENPISFSSSDSLIGAKKDGPIDKLIDKSTGTGAIGGKVSVEFNKPITIEGKLEVTSGDKSKEIDLDDPILMRNLSKILREEISKAINGSKLSSNPAPA